MNVPVKLLHTIKPGDLVVTSRGIRGKVMHRNYQGQTILYDDGTVETIQPDEILMDDPRFFILGDNRIGNIDERALEEERHALIDQANDIARRLESMRRCARRWKILPG